MGVLDRFRLDGKQALVTGCSRGLGKSMALALAEAGADIIGVSATLAPTGSDIEKEVNARGKQFRGYQCDFGQRKALYAFLKQLKADIGTVDILVNNAGIIRRIPAVEHADEWWDKVIEINLTSQFILSREIGKEMVARGSGKIICVGSLLTFQGGILVPGYAASKGGVGQLVKALANEWAEKGVNVNGIAPGYVITDATEEIQNDPIREKEILKRIPAQRWGVADDFKGIIVFLSSQASDYVHGTLITIDGGWMGR